MQLFEQAKQAFDRQDFGAAVKLATQSIEAKEFSKPISPINMLALIHAQFGEFAEAHRLVKMAYRLDPSQVETFQSFIFTLLMEENYHQIVVEVESWVKTNTPTQMLLSFYVVALGQCGFLEQALQVAQLVKKPEETILKDNISRLTAFVMYQYPVERWQQHFLTKARVERAPLLQQLMFQCSLLIEAWLLAEDEVLAKRLRDFARLLKKFDQHKVTYHFAAQGEKIRSSVMATKAFHEMFRKFSASNAPALQPELPRLYAIGESHALVPHRQKVDFSGKQYQVRTEFVEGLKLWHLAKPGRSRFRSGCELALQRPPRGSIIVVFAGEIDTRPHDGLWPTFKKKGEELTPLLEKTFLPAAKWLAQQRPDCQVLLAGFPQPRRDRTREKIRDPDEITQYEAMAAQARDVWQTAVWQTGLPLLDFWQLSVDHPEMFLEQTHLKPAALQLALQHYLRPPLGQETF